MSELTVRRMMMLEYLLLFYMNIFLGLSCKNKPKVDLKEVLIK